jgi:serine/threonine protein kinase
MEYVPHGTLYEVIHSDIKLEMITILRIAENIASSIKRLHDIQPPIIHRDLKSPNILVVSLDPTIPVLVKLADLGLSCRVTSEVKRDKNLTNLDWMAPEVMLQKPYTEKADIFSFGIILWELVSRKHPYEEFTFNFMVQKEENISLKGVRPTIPEGTPEYYSSLIRDCWNQKPNLRPNFSDILIRLSRAIRELTPSSCRENTLLGCHKERRTLDS